MAIDVLHKNKKNILRLKFIVANIVSSVIPPRDRHAILTRGNTIRMYVSLRKVQL